VGKEGLQMTDKNEMLKQADIALAQQAKGEKDGTKKRPYIYPRLKFK
jgi:hypothetical protein